MKNFIGKFGKFDTLPASFWYEILGYYRGINEDYFIIVGETKKLLHMPIRNLIKIKDDTKNKKILP